MFYKLFEALDKRFGLEQAQAHCDVPCGIYDPIVAQIGALTVVRMPGPHHIHLEPEFVDRVAKQIRAFFGLDRTDDEMAA